VILLDLSTVIVSYNTRDMLRDCLRSLPAATAGLAVETFVVDNASPDDSAAMVAAEFPNVRLIANTENAGFTRANNQALRLSVGRYVLLLNPDTEADPGSLTTLARYLDTHPDVGAVGPKLVNTDGSLQPNGRRFPNPWRDLLGHIVLPLFHRGPLNLTWEYAREDFDKEWETDLVTGACLMTRHEIMDRVGMLDEDFFMFYEEIEWCWRIRKAGWKIAYVPQARVVHHWMGSVRQQSRAMTARLFRSMLIYYGKTAGPLAQIGARGVVLLAWIKYQFIYLGVAIKRRLRAARLIR
jgi:N-acetylglucosaminyl-diphospho-decaprenol L-rhamnosyltransferase